MRISNLTRFFVAGLSILCLTGFATAQDVDQDEVRTGGESIEMTVIGGDELGGAPMIFSTVESFDGETTSGMRIMSGGAGGMTFLSGMGGDFVMPAPDPWSMLNNPSVQKDLELVGDQLASVQELQSKFAQEMKEQIGDISKGGLSKDRLQELPALMEKIRAEQREKMEGMLLPHQVARLQQVALQTHLKQAGTAGALASEKVAEALGISKEQIERLKARSKEINEQLAKDTEALKEKAKEELLQELTPDQRNKLKEMTGDKYEPQTKDWQDSLKTMRRPRRRVQRDND